MKAPILRWEPTTYGAKKAPAFRAEAGILVLYVHHEGGGWWHYIAGNRGQSGWSAKPAPAPEDAQLAAEAKARAVLRKSLRALTPPRTTPT